MTPEPKHLLEACSDICLNYSASGGTVKIYSLTGYLIILVYMLACMFSAPSRIGPWTGLLIGGVYFVFCWFLAGLYLAAFLHLGIAHRSLDYKAWFIKAVTM